MQKLKTVESTLPECFLQRLGRVVDWEHETEQKSINAYDSLSNLNNAFSAPNIWTVDDGCLAKFRSDPVIENTQVEATRLYNI